MKHNLRVYWIFHNNYFEHSHLCTSFIVAGKTYYATTKLQYNVLRTATSLQKFVALPEVVYRIFVKIETCPNAFFGILHFSSPIIFWCHKVSWLHSLHSAVSNEFHQINVVPALLPEPLWWTLLLRDKAENCSTEAVPSVCIPISYVVLMCSYCFQL